MSLHITVTFWQREKSRVLCGWHFSIGTSDLICHHMLAEVLPLWNGWGRTQCAAWLWKHMPYAKCIELDLKPTGSEQNQRPANSPEPFKRSPSLFQAILCWPHWPVFLWNVFVLLLQSELPVLVVVFKVTSGAFRSMVLLKDFTYSHLYKNYTNPFRNEWASLLISTT